MTPDRFRERARKVPLRPAGERTCYCTDDRDCAPHQAIARLAAEVFNEGMERAAEIASRACRHCPPDGLTFCHDNTAAAIRAAKEPA